MFFRFHFFKNITKFVPNAPSKILQNVFKYFLEKTLTLAKRKKQKKVEEGFILDKLRELGITKPNGKLAIKDFRKWLITYSGKHNIHTAKLVRD